jgi:gluconate 2-dehydrogenase gamma chain
MSEISRRDLLRNVALSAALGGLTVEAAQHVHNMAADEKKQAAGAYKVKAFTPQEWATLRRLCDLIFPADQHSKGALEGGAPEFIDLLASANKEIAAMYTGGLAWLDAESNRRFNAPFVKAAAPQQTELLDLIAYRRNAESNPALGPGVRFFDWARKMTSDAYYTSKVGVADLGFVGNKGMPEFQVPAEALQYALKRSGL